MPQEFTAKFKVDITDLKRNISNAQKAIKEANATFKANTAGMDRWSDNADGLTEKLSQLDKILTNQKTILASYKSELTKQKEAYAENSKRAEELKKKLQELASQGVDKASEEYKQYKRALQNVLKEQENNEKAADDLKITILNQEAAVKNTEKEIRHYKDSLDHLDDSTEEVTKDTKDANEGFTVMKGVLADLASSAIKKAISGLKNLGKAAIEAYKDYDKGADNIIKATGATGDAAKELEESYKNVSKKVVGDFDNIGSAMGEINTRFGFTGKNLEDASEKFVKFSEITGTDTVSAVQSVSRMMEKAGIKSEDYGNILDALAVASQQSGISVDDLADKIEKSGTTMQGLGFDTEETIALFAQWEKAGVKTEDAFGGMRKAFQKWAKQGKDSKTEFQKVLKEIKNAPNTTKATQKAIEIFGNKAGPELAKAIQEGKLEYDDFLKTLKNSKGTVEKTYEATQDGFDKIKLVIQGAKTELGSYVSDMAKKYAPQIEEFAGKVVEGLKKAIKWVAENSKVVAGFAAAIAGAFAVTKIANFVSAISKTVSVFVSVGKAIGGVTGATKLLSAAFSASPLGLVITAVAGLTGAFIALRKAQEKELQEQYGLNDAQQKTVEAATQIKASYDETARAREESMGAVDAEFGHIENLRKQYDELIGSNGKVKKGYEDRASYILDELSKALGVEREEIEKTIKKNGKLGKSIDELILKKRAEAILSANEAAFTEAIQNQGKALETLQKSQQTAREAEENYNAVLAETSAEREKISNAMAHAVGDTTQYQYQLGELAKKENIAKTAMEEANKAVTDAETAYVGYMSEIQNYENLGVAISSGNAKKISAAMDDLQNNLITAKNGTRQTLEQQHEDAKEMLARLEKDFANGMNNVTEETVKQAREMEKKTKKELDLWYEDFGKSFDAVAKLCEERGIEIPESTAAGIKNGAYAVPQSVEEMQSLITYDTSVKAAKLAGVDIPKEVSDGIASGKLKPAEAAAIVNKLLIDKFSEAEKPSKEKGEKSGGAYASGVESKKGESESAGAAVKNSAISGMSGGEQAASTEGSNMGGGFISGLWGRVTEAASTAWNFVTSMINSAKQANDSNSPSKKWRDEVGAMSGEGYIVGLASKSKEAARAARDFVLGAAKSAENNSKWGDFGSSLRGGISGVSGSISGTAGYVGGKTMVYNQTINSPKALSRIELYRQTKNLLELAKMGA